MINENIDNGKSFDWGKTSEDYAKFRDIYPQEMYDEILSYGLCEKGQRVLDLGTGTGVLPRNMYKYGAEFVGTDISENQIEQAKRMSQRMNMDIQYFACHAEELDFDDETFDVVTAFTCFFYFEPKVLSEKLSRIMKKGGHLIIGYLAWLPFEDKIAEESEKLILKYNPQWSGCGETRRKVDISNEYLKYFEIVHYEYYDVKIPFTKQSWTGRIKACRGIGASLAEDKIAEFEKEHLKMLDEFAKNSFEIQHYYAIAVLKLK